ASRDASMGDATIPELSLADKTGLRGLTVFDISEHSETDPNADRADVTQPTSVTTDLEAPSKTVTRADTTSTETYAPDNYDRTLQRSENRDASNYFTGMKSDTGTVLTAEHAKKIFHSKSSSHRMQKFKLYGGLVVAILVVFFGMGVYQLDGEIEKIDNSLRPLKRDPLPGLIKNVADQGFTDVLAAASGSEVDSRVLELVEGAETDVGIDEVVGEIGLEVPDPPEGTNESQTDGYQDEPEAVSMEVSVQPPMEVSEQQPAAVSEPVIEASANDLSDEATGPVTSARFQISTRTTITEKDQWLLEAYAAYQRGDDETAWAKYNAVLEIDPENRNALLARAAMNIHNNNIAAAIRDYRVLLIANPKDSLAISSLTAVVNISPEQSESQLKLLIRDEPDSPYLNFALGNVYGAQNRWQEAQGQYFTALEHNPDDPNYAYNLAVSLEHIARPSVAISYYQLALDNFNKGLATFNRDVVDQRLEMLRQL
ncbi:MAG: tetratricopeptide repeat protein, partial [Gammaproteobacteria bacterium]|nr:tetratricopeptide repeat protein [Gammaproteobacteria bacterium]